MEQKIKPNAIHFENDDLEIRLYLSNDELMKSKIQDMINCYCGKIDKEYIEYDKSKGHIIYLQSDVFNAILNETFEILNLSIGCAVNSLWIIDEENEEHEAIFFISSITFMDRIIGADKRKHKSYIDGKVIYVPILEVDEYDKVFDTKRDKEGEYDILPILTPYCEEMIKENIPNFRNHTVIKDGVVYAPVLRVNDYDKFLDEYSNIKNAQSETIKLSFNFPELKNISGLTYINSNELMFFAFVVAYRLGLDEVSENVNENVQKEDYDIKQRFEELLKIFNRFKEDKDGLAFLDSIDYRKQLKKGDSQYYEIPITYAPLFTMYILNVELDKDGNAGENYKKDNLRTFLKNCKWQNEFGQYKKLSLKAIEVLKEAIDLFYNFNGNNVLDELLEEHDHEEYDLIYCDNEKNASTICKHVYSIDKKLDEPEKISNREVVDREIEAYESTLTTMRMQNYSSEELKKIKNLKNELQRNFDKIYDTLYLPKEEEFKNDFFDSTNPYKHGNTTINNISREIAPLTKQRRLKYMEDLLKTYVDNIN